MKKLSIFQTYKSLFKAKGRSFLSFPINFLCVQRLTPLLPRTKSQPNRTSNDVNILLHYGARRHFERSLLLSFSRLFAKICISLGGSPPRIDPAKKSDGFYCTLRGYNDGYQIPLSSAVLIHIIAININVEINLFIRADAATVVENIIVSAISPRLLNVD